MTLSLFVSAHIFGERVEFHSLLISPILTFSVLYVSVRQCVKLYANRSDIQAV